MKTFKTPALMHIPFLSTAHITAADGRTLRNNADRDALATIKGGSGHIIHFSDEEIDDDFSDHAGYSQAFRSLLHSLAVSGFCYVRLDADGDVIEGQPVFDWEDEPTAGVPDPEDMNDTRAEWAGDTLEHFCSLTGADLEDGLSDLLSNLAHYCDRRGLSLKREFSRARSHYADETDGKGAQFHSI